MSASQRNARGSGTAATSTPLIDASAAGALLGVPASWVLAEARAGRIPHIRLGRYVRFDPDEVLDWARGGQHHGPRPAGQPRESTRAER